ncbi:MAG: GntR family transcriptional regulator [Verrucomicrobiae bacterium]|nr:GntR family transcriptional regulator [Verrucomicrobiae bacterium]
MELQIQKSDPPDVQIERYLRQQIAQGELRSNEQLPPTAELVRRWHVSRTAIHRAMTRLVADGVIIRKRKCGTFVNSATAKANIAILIGPSLMDETSYFHRALCKCLRAEIVESENRHWACRVYDGFYEFQGKPGASELPPDHPVLSDLRNHPFKGVVQVLAGLDAMQSAKLEFNLPTVRLGPVAPGLQADVLLDYRSFGRDAVTSLAQRGMHRIVYVRAIYSTIDTQEDLRGIREAVKLNQLPEVEVHGLKSTTIRGRSMEQAAYEKTLELIAKWQGRHGFPDAILISDDIATRGVALALVQSPKAAARQPLTLLTLANEGIEHHYGLPVERYDFSPRLLAQTMLKILHKRMLDEQLPELPVRVTNHPIQLGSATRNLKTNDSAIPGHPSSSACLPMFQALARFRPLRLNRQVSSAMTLIELLVVMCLLSILMCLLMPGLKAAKESAKSMNCLNNLRQLGLAVRSYVEENNGFFPPSSISSPVRHWPDILAPYVQYTCAAGAFYIKKDVYYCPSTDYKKFYYWYLTYGYNYYGCGCADNYATRPWPNIFMLSRPAEMLMLCDTYSTYQPNTSYNNAYPGTTGVVGGNGVALGRHLGNVNIAYVDGHVGCLPQNDVINADSNGPLWNMSYK